MNSMRWLWILWFMLASGTNLAGAEEPGLRMARRGRIVSYTAVAAMGLGGAMAATGVPLRQYDSDVPWFEKAAYDRRYLQRQTAADVLQFSAIGLGAAHLPLLATGVMLEAGGLRRLDRGHPVALGWVGVGLLAGSATSTPLAFLGPGGAVIVISTSVVGYALLWAQLGQNAATVRHLPPDLRARLRLAPRRRTTVAAAPWILPGGGGGRLVVGFP